jgi:hypothetical protein
MRSRRHPGHGRDRCESQAGPPEAIQAGGPCVIPGIFPPVNLEVTAAGKTYHEMHVDGCASNEVFLMPAGLTLHELDRTFHTRVTARLYVIRNGRTTPEPRIVKLTLPDIAEKAVSSPIKTQGIGDLYRLYAISRRDGIDYNFIDIQAISRSKRRPRLTTTTCAHYTRPATKWLVTTCLGKGLLSKLKRYPRGIGELIHSHRSKSLVCRLDAAQMPASCIRHPTFSDLPRPELPADATCEREKSDTFVLNLGLLAATYRSLRTTHVQ